MNLTNKIPSHYPNEWKPVSGKNVHFVTFRNLTHFKAYMKKSPTASENRDNIFNFSESVGRLLKNKTTIKQAEYEVVKNAVKNKLLKRGLISENVYESYRYDVEGDMVDVGKLVEGDPACCLVPNHTYTNYFYELYINMTYNANITNEEVTAGVQKILATIQLLEEEHIFCKLSLVISSEGTNKKDLDDRFISVLPVFSHRDTKTIESMSSIVNERYLRCFGFAMFDDVFEENVAGNLGYTINLPHTIYPHSVVEEDLASSILDKIIEKGTR